MPPVHTTIGRVCVDHKFCREPAIAGTGRLAIQLGQGSRLLRDPLLTVTDGVYPNYPVPEPYYPLDVPLPFRPLADLPNLDPPLRSDYAEGDTNVLGFILRNHDEELKRWFRGEFFWEGLGEHVVVSEVSNVHGCAPKHRLPGWTRAEIVLRVTVRATFRVTAVAYEVRETGRPWVEAHNGDGQSLEYLEIHKAGPERDPVELFEYQMWTLHVINRHTVNARQLRIRVQSEL